jgi:hypothetical protein
MNAWTRRHWLKAILAMSLPIGACAEKSTAITSTTMNTHHIGRYLIDLPEGFELLGETLVHLYFGLDADAVRVDFTLLTSRCTDEDFRLRVAKRIAELSAQRHRKLDRAMLVFERSIVAGRQHLIRSFDNIGLTNFFRSDIFTHVGAALVHLTALSKEGAQEKNERYLMQVAEQLLPISADETSQRGFAVGPVLIASKHQQEIGSIEFFSATTPDVSIIVNINALTPDTVPALLGRWDSNLPLVMRVMPGGPGTVRRGKVAIAGMGGEELLIKMQIHDRRVMKFFAESHRAEPSLASPLIELRLNTEPLGVDEGDWKPPLWSEKETVAVWDRIVRSIRPRPGSV